MALIAMPCAAGLFVMAEPVIRLLCSSYSEDRIQLAAPMMAILGLAVVFNSLVLLLNAIMQAHGDVTTPVINMLIGGIVKIIVNYILVGQPALNIIGAPIGTLVCYIAITALDIVSMRRHISARPTIFKNIVRPLIASALMGGATFLVYRVLSSRLGSWKLSCLVSLAFAVVLYAVLVVALQCVTYEELHAAAQGRKNRETPENSEKKLNKKPCERGRIMINFTSKDRYDFADLQRLVEVLRAPGGCPWTARRPTFPSGEISWKKLTRPARASIWTIRRICARNSEMCCFRFCSTPILSARQAASRWMTCATRSAKS